MTVYSLNAGGIDLLLAERIAERVASEFQLSGERRSTLATALWVDLFGARELARVRSAVEAGAVLASGASPIAMGLLIDAGVPLSLQALGCCAFSLAASALTLPVMLRKGGRSA